MVSVLGGNKPVKEEGMFLTIMNLLVKMMSVPLTDDGRFRFCFKVTALMCRKI